MAKDIIFKDKPPVKECVNERVETNDTLEAMKQEIKNISSIRLAVQILLKKWSRDYVLFIAVAIREKFPKASSEEIGQCLP